MGTYANLWQCVAFFFWNEKCLEKVVEKFKTYITFSNFFSENGAVYDIMLKNMVETNRPQMTT